MKTPISIFILDVSNSSTKNNGDELSQYLDDIVSWITIWTDGLVNIKAKHRAGDEIIFAGEGYSTAYTIAFFISRIWRYKHNHPPYFGLSFGDSSKNLEEIDIERWIDPLLKQARYANNLLKEEKNRPLFKFELDQFLPNQQNNPFRYEFEMLINQLLKLQQNFIWRQTSIQELVCSLYFIFEQQTMISSLLDKSQPTISSHLKKGNYSDIFVTFHTIQAVLYSLQSKHFPEQSSPAEKLTQSIKKHLKSKAALLIQGGE